MVQQKRPTQESSNLPPVLDASPKSEPDPNNPPIQKPLRNKEMFHFTLALRMLF